MLSDCAQSLFSGSDLLIAFGWLFAASMVIGSILDDGHKQLISWLIAVGIFAVALQFVHSYFLQTIQGTPLEVCKSGSITIISTLLYSIGMATGWSIVYLAKKWARRDIGVRRKA